MLTRCISAESRKLCHSMILSCLPSYPHYPRDHGNLQLFTKSGNPGIRMVFPVDAEHLILCLFLFRAP